MPRPLILLLACALATAVAAQTPPADAPARRLTDRLRDLQRENEQLAGQSRSLVAELRELEAARNARTAEAAAAEAEAAAARAALAEVEGRLAELEAQRASQLPDLQAQLVDIYKRGRGGYARLLFASGSLRDLARSTRAVAALAAINERRVAEHQRTLQALAAERARLAETAAALDARETAAVQARVAAERAVAARAALITRIDSRRDLTAQYAGELQVAYARLQQQLTAAGDGAPAVFAVPIAPFRGALEWPTTGTVSGRFGQRVNRLGGTAVRNGIEIAGNEGAAVRAVHGGTVGYAGDFTGLGTLVILEHGGNDFSLYGYLSAVSVEPGQAVPPGAEVGRVGLAPAGPPALYFELRIDGRSVDPLQWLEPR